MDDIDRLICAIWAAAMCGGKTSDHGDYFQAYDYFVSMVRGREERAAAQRTERPAGTIETLMSPTRYPGR